MKHQSRSGFAVKLMKFKFLGPSFARAPSKALGGALVTCSRGHMFFDKFAEVGIIEPVSVKYYRGVPCS
jgi:hypothetical protein